MLAVKVFSLSLLFLSPSWSWAKVLDMNPPGMKKLVDNQARRLPKIRDFKFDGYIGETEKALLAVRTTKGLKKDKVKALKKLVDDENADRKKIISLITSHNKLDKKSQKDLVDNFYRVYKNTSAKGTYYFDGQGWFKKH